MNNMFKDCNSLTNLDVSNFDTSNVTNMSGMFEGCTNLESVDLTGIDTSKIKDMSNMFDGCSNLTTITPENIEVPEGTKTDGLFNGCENLTEIPVKKTFEVSLVANRNGTITPATLSIDFGKMNTFTVTPNTGYYLSEISCTNGYKTNAVTGNEATSVQNVTLSNNYQNTNSICTASFEMATYTIDYDLNDGTVNGNNPSSFRIDSEPITLLNPTKIGYTFTGWTGSNGDTPETSVTIPTGSIENKNYTANFEVDSYDLVINVHCPNCQFDSDKEKTKNYKINYNNSFRFGIWDTATTRAIISSMSCTNGYQVEETTYTSSNINTDWKGIKITNTGQTTGTTCDVTYTRNTFTVSYTVYANGFTFANGSATMSGSSNGVSGYPFLAAAYATRFIPRISSFTCTNGFVPISVVATFNNGTYFGNVKIMDRGSASNTTTCTIYVSQ